MRGTNSAFCVAVHALVYLNHKGRLLSSEELAENICTNPARVRKVMAGLKKTGWLETRGGNAGGYRLTAPAADITLDRVAEALDIRFVEAAWRSGDTDMDCLIASGMADRMDEILADLDGLCRRRLAEISVADLDRSLFGQTNLEKRES